MLSVRLNGEVLEVRFETFMGPEDYKRTCKKLELIPHGRQDKESRLWIFPKVQVDFLNNTFPNDLAWHTSIEEIKGIREVVIPKFEVLDEGLEDMKLEPRPFQTVGVSFLHDLKQGLLADEMGLGKAQPLDAKVLTPLGWKLMGEVEVGDKVIGSEGFPIEVLKVFPQGEKDIYRVAFSDGSSTECCDEHLWAINTTTRRFRGNPYIVKELCEFKDDLKLASGNNKYFIPIVKPVEFNGSELPLRSYLLGYLLGNGALSGNSTPGVTIPDEETRRRLRSMLPINTTLSWKTDIDYRIIQQHNLGENPVVKVLRDLDLIGKRSYEKHIPDIYKFAKVEDRIALLQGLLDSDGHVRPKDNNIEFSSSSKQLAEDVSFIVQSLGGTAPIREKETTHRLAYRMSIALPVEIEPFLLSRKAKVYHPRAKYFPSRAIVSVEFICRKEAQCILVDAEDHLYVTDDFIVTHNTPQAIGATHLLRKEGEVKKALVICPSSLKYQWQEEIQKFTDYHGIVIDGTPSEREEQLNEWISNPFYLFAITNYELVRNDIDLLTKLKYELIIVDEVHRIKNWASKTSQALKQLDAPYKFGLTGTPMQNNPVELYNIMDFLNPTILGNFWAFDKRYVVRGEKFGQKNVVIGYRNLGELRRKVGPFMLRRMKKEVAPELPEMTYNTYIVEQTPEQQRLNDTIHEDFSDLLKEIQAWNLQNPDATTEHPKKGQMLGYFTMLLEVSDSPELLQMSDSNMAQRYAQHINKKPKSPKLDELVRIAQDQLEAGNKKMVIFTQFAQMQKLVVERLSEIGKCEILNGSMKPFERQAAVDRFKYNEKVNFFVTTDAGNYGINLQFANVLVHMDLPWNPATKDQRDGRVHRIGSAFKEVIIIHLITKDGIDERIQETLYKKRELAGQIVEKNDEEKAAINALTAGLMKKLIKKKTTRKKKED